MKCNWGWVEIILSALILIFVIFPTQIFSTIVSFWIVVVAAAILLIHALKPHKEHYHSFGSTSGVSKGKRKR